MVFMKSRHILPAVLVCAVAVGCGTAEREPSPAPTTDTQQPPPAAERYEREIDLLQDHIATLEAEREDDRRRIDELENLLGARQQLPRAQPQTRQRVSDTRDADRQEDDRRAAINRRLANLRAEINRLRSRADTTESWLIRASSDGKVSAEQLQAIQAGLDRTARRVEQLEEQAFVLEQQLLAPR